MWLIINQKISQKFSKFFPNILKILFKTYFKYRINLIPNLSKISKNVLKIFAIFIPKSFPEISTNFSKIFIKSFVEILIKFYSRIAQTLVKVYSKFPWKFSLFRTISINFYLRIFSSHLNISTISQSKSSKIVFKM